MLKKQNHKNIYIYFFFLLNSCYRKLCCTYVFPYTLEGLEKTVQYEVPIFTLVYTL